MVDEQHMQKAREIVQTGGTIKLPFDAAAYVVTFYSRWKLRDDIASALSEAYRSGVEAGMAQCETIATDEAERWERIRASGDEPSIQPAARMLAAGTIACLIHDRLVAIRKA